MDSAYEHNFTFTKDYRVFQSKYTAVMWVFRG